MSIFSGKPKVAYYCLDAAAIPDEDYKPETPVAKWHSRCTTAGPEGFAAGAFSQLSAVPTSIIIERSFGIPLYLWLNVLPFALPLSYLCGVHWLVLAYTAVLSLGFGGCALLLPRPKLATDKGMEGMQYAWTERNISKYLSTKFCWPASAHLLADKSPLLFLVIPHGFAPLGITAYPLWSKLFGARLCRWTAAPFVLKIPLIGAGLRAVGYLPAKAKAIEDALAKKEQSVGVILDGVAGMFTVKESVEVAYVKQRKGIVKVALRAGAPMVPVYAFGHTALWSVLTDPFGLLAKLSVRLDVSLVFGLGRWGWPLGPPRRTTPVLMAVGEPIVCPQTAEPSKEMVDEYHAKLCAGYRAVFDAHKGAFGWGHKQLEFV